VSPTDSPKKPAGATASEYLLFVYGTFLSGEPEHARLSGARALGPAETEPTYDLVDLGVEPALVPGGTGAVKGEVYAVTPSQLAAVDVHHGHPLKFRRGTIRLADGRLVEAHQLAPDQTRGRRRIRTGDWKTRFAPRAADDDRAWSRFARERGRAR
jgi:gamma-glutamylcyclotransferase (GGCT)/AIG2-like uncharacterized protein YtfP